MRISDWSSDVCSSDLGARQAVERRAAHGRRLEGRHELRQRVAQLHAAAELFKLFAADHVDRGRARNDGTSLAAGAGDDDFGLGGRFTGEIGRAHVLTPVTNAHLVCRLLLEKKKTY